MRTRTYKHTYAHILAAICTNGREGLVLPVLGRVVQLVDIIIMHIIWKFLCIRVLSWLWMTYHWKVVGVEQCSFWLCLSTLRLSLFLQMCHWRDIFQEASVSGQ